MPLRVRYRDLAAGQQRDVRIPLANSEQSDALGLASDCIVSQSVGDAAK
jgi:hypothetical protein